MDEPVVRVSQGFFEPQQYEIVAARLEEGRSVLEPALCALPGLVHYYESFRLSLPRFDGHLE
jgi:hypothetical protein